MALCRPSATTKSGRVSASISRVVGEDRRAAERRRPLRRDLGVGVLHADELHVGHGREVPQIRRVVQRVPVAHLDGGDPHQRLRAPRAAGARRPRVRVAMRCWAAETPDAQAPWIAPNVFTVHASPAKKTRSPRGRARGPSGSARIPGARRRYDPRAQRSPTQPVAVLRRIRGPSCVPKILTTSSRAAASRASLSLEIPRVVAAEIGEQ